MHEGWDPNVDLTGGPTKAGGVLVVARLAVIALAATKVHVAVALAVHLGGRRRRRVFSQQ